MKSFVLKGNISEVIAILKWWEIIECANYVLKDYERIKDK